MFCTFKVGNFSFWQALTFSFKDKGGQQNWNYLDINQTRFLRQFSHNESGKIQITVKCQVIQPCFYVALLRHHHAFSERIISTMIN